MKLLRTKGWKGKLISNNPTEEEISKLLLWRVFEYKRAPLELSNSENAKTLVNSFELLRAFFAAFAVKPMP